MSWLKIMRAAILSVASTGCLSNSQAMGTINALDRLLPQTTPKGYSHADHQAYRNLTAVQQRQRLNLLSGDIDACMSGLFPSYSHGKDTRYIEDKALCETKLGQTLALLESLTMQHPELVKVDDIRTLELEGVIADLKFSDLSSHVINMASAISCNSLIDIKVRESVWATYVNLIQYGDNQPLSSDKPNQRWPNARDNCPPTSAGLAVNSSQP